LHGAPAEVREPAAQICRRRCKGGQADPGAFEARAYLLERLVRTKRYAATFEAFEAEYLKRATENRPERRTHRRFFSLVLYNHAAFKILLSGSPRFRERSSNRRLIALVSARVAALFVVEIVVSARLRSAIKATSQEPRTLMSTPDR